MPTSTNRFQSETIHRESAGLILTARILSLAVILVAYALRSYHLEYQSLAGDEGISLIRSAQQLGPLIRNMPIEHVPGYFVLLHFWMLAAGQTDFAIRYLSLLPGVFAVAVMIRMGTDFGSRRAGLMAATLLATSAFQVWYAQETRMYSWLLVAGSVSTWYLWLLFTRAPRLSYWLGYVMSTSVAIYLHYFGFLIPMVHTAVAVLWFVTRRNVRAFLYWVAAGIAVLVLFLPWAGRTLELFGFPGWRAPIDPNRIPWLLLQTYTAGETMPEIWSRWIPLLYLALIILGAAAWYRRRKDTGFFLSTLAISAILLTWLLVVRQPDFHVRYTIFVSAPLILLTAGGIAGLSPTWWRRKRPEREEDTAHAIGIIFRAIPWLMLAFLVFANGLALNRLYHDSTVQRPDYRSAATHIQDNLQPGDIILVDGPNPELVFNHYYDGPAPVVSLRDLEGRPDTEVYDTLQELTADAKRAWELLYFKPPGPVQVWLATRGWAAAPTFHNGIRVQLVGLDRVDMQKQAIGTYFGDALQLIDSAYDVGPHMPGDLMRISTHWHTHTQAPEYKFSLRLWDDNGNELDAFDYIPQNWFAPTNVWLVDKPATDQHGLLLPHDLAPGPYRVTLRLYDPYSGVPVETTLGIDVPIADILVEEGPPASE